MRIVHVASEFAPVAKAGGLGEVIVGLARELNRCGHPTEILLPKYKWITPPSKNTPIIQIPCMTPHHRRASQVFVQEIEGSPIHFIEMMEPAGHFDHNTIYGYADDTVRFLNFNLACADYFAARKEPIDILHLHDWHAAALAPLIRGPLASRMPPIHKIILTIHNLEYQGLCSPWELEAAGLPFCNQMQDNRYPEAANLLKGGILYSDIVTTVSPSYAREIQQKESGFGLHEELRRVCVKGILNGIDTHRWDPSSDSIIAETYQKDSSTDKIVQAKLAQKRVLQSKFNLSSTHRPWIGVVTRLVPQKGTELLKEALRETVRLGGNFILLGASPIPSLQEDFDMLKEQYGDCDQVLLEYSYDEALAHQIYAACDFFIVPSLFEPCGLSQMIALRYATLPIVRSTGGLKDTVFDYENPIVPAAQRNGIVFHSFSVEAVREAVDRAIALWRDEMTFQWLLRHGMQQEFGWHKPGSRYLRMYEKALTPDDELPKDIPLPNRLNKKRPQPLTKRSPVEEILPK